MTTIALHNLNFDADRKYIVGAFTLLIGLLALYMYFVSLSVVHVVIRQEMQQEINNLNTEISHLEAEYIAAQHSVSAEIASMDGYVEIQDKIFIERTDDTALVLSSNVE